MTDDIHWSLASDAGSVVTKYRASQNCSFIRDFSSRTELYQVENTWVILSAPYLIFGPKNDPIFIWVVSLVTRDETRGHVSN